MHFADRLTEAVQQKKVAACVGFDPLLERLPSALLSAHDIDLGDGKPIDPQAAASAVVEFGSAIIELITPHIPAIKINIAFFEPLYDHGVRAYHELISKAHDAGLVVVGDVKRADIGHTSMQYAKAQLGCSASMEHARMPDAITVNPYFGSDGVDPFIEVANENDRGVFVLVQTSNASAVAVQGLTLPSGETVCQKVAGLVQSWACDVGQIGGSGYSNVGAVVSPRDLPSTCYIRELMSHCIFLVPGFGAQGRTAEEVKACFKADGTGALVTASRSVIYAYNSEKYSSQHPDDWQTCISLACRDLAEQIRSVTAR